MIDLSVLVCSTHTRWDTFGQAIQRQLWSQYRSLSPEAQQSVEILMLTDNKQMMLGHKRNVMVDMAQGRYVVFVDDDDRLEPDYLASLLDATVSDADVITFLVSVTLNGGKPKLCRYSRDFKSDRNPAGRYERMPNHICAVKREIARQVSFPNIAYGEDSGYSKLLQPLLQSEHHIPRVLYHYDYNIETTEAQEHRRAALRRRDEKPIVDVVIISDARTPALANMTQEAINTCLAGANSLPVNIIVVEGHPSISYQHAKMLSQTGDFNYNHYANQGAVAGTAPWIMVANNDLIFHDGWLHRLLAADHPVVSPKCPHDNRQKKHTENVRGQRVGEHFSGWCFMLQRGVWERIGGFDEDFPFWCADDATVQQVVSRASVEPMLVPGATVEHLRSMTLQQEAEPDELCWPGIEKFVEKYGPHRLTRHPGYQHWKQKVGK
jgi:hypothetical protein